MQTIVHEIFAAFGGATAIHRETGWPVQTIHNWVAKGEPHIPHWRRDRLLELTGDKHLSSEALEYLGSGRAS